MRKRTAALALAGLVALTGGGVAAGVNAQDNGPQTVVTETTEIVAVPVTCCSK